MNKTISNPGSYTFTAGETFPGTDNDDNGGSISTAIIDVGINVGAWGNRIEIRVRGGTDKWDTAEATAEAEKLRDYVISALLVAEL